MRNLTYFVMVLALVLGFTQCKKEQIEPQNQGEQVRITLNVNGGGNGSKVVVNPPHVTFGEDDQILVAYDGKYVGTITHNGTNFSGDITITQNGDQPLYFYFLGNQTISNLTETNCTFDIFDQTDASKMPVVSFGASKENYSSGLSSYSSKLSNQCALVKLNVTNTTGAKTYIMGMNNMATVNFANTASNPFTFSKMGTGAINIGTRTGEVWVILFPNASAVTDKAYSSNWAKNGSISVHEIEADGYYTDGISINLDTDNKGTLPGKFTGGNNNVLHFSMSNLKATTTDSWETWTFSFMEHQYDKVETDNVGDDYSSSNAVGLFGWGTSGYNHGAVCYKPNSTSSTTTSYYAYYDFDNLKTHNLYDNTGQADWGYNSITNGGASNTWHTPTKDDWVWILGPNSPSPGTNCRTSSTVNGIENARYTGAIINGTHQGVIVFPDTYAGTPNGVTWGDINSFSSWQYKTTCTTAGWEALEAAGCVFLPAAGYRSGNTFTNSGGGYWSSKHYDGYYVVQAYYMSFGNSLGSEEHYNKCQGRSVRLVRVVP